MSIPARPRAKAASAKESSCAAASTIICRTAGLYWWLSRRSGIRWGEKVPAAIGTVADRLAVGDRMAALNEEGAVLEGDRAEAAAGGAGLLRAEALGLLLQEGGEGAL